MNRRHFLHAAGTAAPAGLGAAARADSRFEWLEASAADLSHAMAEGRTSALAARRDRRAGPARCGHARRSASSIPQPC